MQQYAYYHEEDESTFQHVFKTNVPKPLYQRGRYMRNQRNMNQRNQRNQKGPQMQVLGKGNKREMARKCVIQLSSLLVRIFLCRIIHALMKSYRFLLLSSYY